MSLLEVTGLTKRYGGVTALQGADLVVEAGRIHAVLGENGAGKSTLIKILAGVVAPDEGRMLLDGKPVAFASPAAASAAGIVCIFQELSLIPDLSVADNISISQPPRRFGLIDRAAQRRRAEEALARAGAHDIHPLALVKDLSLSRRQMVEIAKALSRRPRILILDEATSALTAADVTKIYAVLKRLRAEGLALIYISHRMHEITELADECTVFCNGRSVARYAAGSENLRRVLLRRIARAAAQHPELDAPRQAQLRAEAEQIIASCIAKNIIDDDAYAVAQARRARAQGKSARLVTAKLRQKGLTQPQITAALATADTSESVGVDPDQNSAGDAEYRAALVSVMASRAVA